MKKFFCCVFLVLSFFQVFSQNSIEELKTELKATRGKEKILIKQKIASEYRYKSPVLSEKYAKESILESKEIHDTLLLIKGLRLLGGAKEFQAQYDSSVYYFQKSKDLAVRINDKREEAIANSNLAFIYIHSEDYSKAISMLSNSIPFFSNDSDSSNLAIVCNNIGTCFFKMNELDSALYYLTRASSLKRLGENQTSYGISMLNIADVYTKKGEYSVAFELLSQALDIFESEGSTYNIAYTNILIADVFKNKKDNERESLYLKLALENASKIESFQLKSDIYKRLSDAYLENEQYKKAHQFFILHKEIDDSLTQVNNTEMVNELKVAYEFDLIQEELELTENKLKLQTSRTIFLLLFICFLGVFLFVLFFQNRKIKSKNILLVEQRLSSKVIIKEPEEGLSDELKHLYKTILIEMENKELFTNASLNVHDLAELLGSNTTYVSKAINSCSKKNFKSFINEFRVNKAIELLTENKQEAYTMAAISDMAGFTSVSVFNRSFKEIVGVTPSFFAENSKNK